MTEDEVRAHIGASGTASVASNGPDGWPHLVPLNYVVIDGHVWFWTHPGSQKARNWERDPRVTVLIAGGEGLLDYRGAVIRGRAEIVGGPEASVRTGIALASQGGARELEEWELDGVQKLAEHRVAVRVDPERVISWDHAGKPIEVVLIGR